MAAERKRTERRKKKKEERRRKKKDESGHYYTCACTQVKNFVPLSESNRDHLILVCEQLFAIWQFNIPIHLQMA